MGGAVPTPTPTPQPTPSAPSSGRDTRTAGVPIGTGPGDLVTLDGKTYVVVEVDAGAVLPSPGGGGTQQARLVEVLPGETAQAALVASGETGTQPSPSQTTPITDIRDFDFPDFSTGFGGGDGETGAGQDGDFREGSLAEFDAACLQGDLEACAIAFQIRQSVPTGDTPGGGLTFEDERALQEIRGEQALEQIRQQLFPSLQQIGRTEAQDVTEGITSGLASSLAAIGLAAPQIFLSNAQDPVGLQNALVTALGSGNAVFPTIERQQLIAEAAQSPTDIIRLLFLSGGQKPPTHRPGAFNVTGVLEEGARAREGLAQEIAALPLPTFEELVDRFTPPLPPIGAAKGAMITMRKDAAGVYRANDGAAVVQGPELFTVGEAGTEFALLAPGSIIAPKASADEPETVENAKRAVAEMLMFGKRQQRPKAAADGAVVPVGGQTPESGLVDESLANLIEGWRGAGAALANPSRSTTERAADLRLQVRPFEGVTMEDRLALLEQAQGDPNLMRFLNIGLTPRARDPLPFASETFADRERILLGAAERELRTEGVDLDAMSPEERGMAVRQRAFQNNPEMFGSAEGALGEIEEQRNQGLFASFAEGAGAAGTQLPFAELLNMPAGARAAFITALGSLFGSDLIADLIGLRSQTRSQGFKANEFRLFL